MSERLQADLPAHAGPARLASLADDVTLADGDREDLAVSAPFTGETVGSVPACTPADVEAAVERAREAQAEWAERSPAARCEVLLEYHDLVLDRQAELLDVTQLEAGKSRLDAFDEVLDVANTARYYGRRAPGMVAPTPREGVPPVLTRVTEYSHPVGVVGVVAPWNYPLTLAVSDALPALAAGNAVVLKPAESTPFTALLARELLVEAGLPPALFAVVTGDGPVLGPPLVDAVDFLQFTGSTATGRTVAARAGERLVDASLELGGKNPLLVLDDADVAAAAEGAARGCFRNAGQLCISFERIYADAAVHDAFREAFVARTRELTLDTGFEYGPEVGSLAGPDQLETVQSHVADAREKGATVLTGGEHRPDLGPYVYEPTVLAGVTDEMLVAREETFGPVVAVHEVDGVEEAVTRANDSEYGLTASVWTADPDRGRRVGRRIDCGTVDVNDSLLAWACVDAPMGGRKQSGLGRRHGAEGLLKFTESQTVAEQRGGSTAPPPAVPQGWYATGMTWAMRLLKRATGLLP